MLNIVLMVADLVNLSIKYAVLAAADPGAFLVGVQDERIKYLAILFLKFVISWCREVLRIHSTFYRVGWRKCANRCRETKLSSRFPAWGKYRFDFTDILIEN